MKRLLVVLCAVALVGGAAVLTARMTAIALFLERLAACRSPNDNSGVPVEDLHQATARIERHLKGLQLPLARRAVDYAELTRRAMGSHWDPLTPAQRSELVGLMRESIDRQILRLLPTDLVPMAPAVQKSDGNQSSVEMSLRYQHEGHWDDLELVLFLHLTPEGWKIWDLVVDEVSLVRNYRWSIRQIVDDQGVSALVATLRKKLTEGS